MEQHEKLIKITPNCWHYRLIKYIWKIDPKMFMNLCPYFWLTIASLFLVPFVWVYKTIANIFRNIIEGVGEYMDRVFDKEIENWLKTLDAGQIIDLERNGFDDSDVYIPSKIRKKTYSFRVIEKWLKMNNITEKQLFEKSGLYDEFKEKVRLKKEAKRLKEQAKKLKKETKQNSVYKGKIDKDRMNKVIKNTKQIAGFLMTVMLAFIFFYFIKLFVFISTLITEFCILNTTECGEALLILGSVAIIMFIIYLYCQRVSSIVDRITDREHANIKEWIISLPAMVFIGVCYVIFYCIIYVFLWKWIIYATYKGLRNALFTFTGIFGEYFGASYSDYCPGIEWGEKEKNDKY